MLKKVILACVLVAQLAAGAWAVSPPADGIHLYKQGKYLPAAQAITAALKTNKNPAMTPTFYYYLGCCYYQSKQSAEATKIYRYIQTAFPHSGEARMAATMLAKLVPSPSSPGAADSAAPADPDNPSDAQVKAVVTAMAAGTATEELSPAALRVLQAATKRSGQSLATAGLSSAGMKAMTAGQRTEDEGPSGENSDLPDTGKFNFQRNDSGHMDVVCYINHSPVNCWFDTGAGAHFGMNHLREAGVDVSKAKPAGVTHGWAGRPVPIWRMVADVKLGNVTRKIPITIEEHMTLSPLIGQDFVEGFQYEIDDKAGIVNMRKSFSGEADKQTVNSLYDVPCSRDGGRDDVVDMSANGRKFKAFIDTGAAFTIMHPATAAKLGIEVPADAEIMTIGGVGGGLNVRVVYLDMRVGPIHKPDFRVLIGGQAGNCVGQDFMQGWRVKIDREKNLLRFFH